MSHHSAHVKDARNTLSVTFGDSSPKGRAKWGCPQLHHCHNNKSNIAMPKARLRFLCTLLGRKINAETTRLKKHRKNSQKIKKVKPKTRQDFIFYERKGINFIKQIFRFSCHKMRIILCTGFKSYGIVRVNS